MDPDLCIRCRGIKNLCGLKSCPLLKYTSIFPRASDLYTGISPPDIFIGRFNYPKVMVSTLSSNINVPEKLYPLNLDDIIKYRTSLYRVGNVQRIDKHSKMVEKIMEISLSISSLDINAEIHKIDLSLDINHISTPMGPKIIAAKIDILNEPKIPNRIENIYDDYDINAMNAIWEIYTHGYSNEYITRLLSGGTLGKKTERKLVPTRWAITAVDDILGKMLIEKIKNYDQLDTIMLAENSYMWNNFLIIFLPGPWSFEMIENWYGKNYFNINVEKSSDYEKFEGRKRYADVVGGAYYAARLAVLEYLNKMQKQASVIVYRTIESDYKIPLGVWVIRETVRDALKKTIILNEKNIKELNINMNVKNILLRSKTAKNIYFQRRIDSYE
ncbi:MAG: Nre family DNA repair protein [Thermoplasmata archaeon]|nr:hypothetical protein [Thermoplasmata archaeon]